MFVVDHETLKVASNFFTNISAAYFIAIVLNQNAYLSGNIYAIIVLLFNIVYTIFYFLLSVQIEKKLTHE